MKPRHVIPGLFLFLLIAYPLSFGPVVRHHRLSQNHAETHTIVTFYRPLIWLQSVCPPVEYLVHAYVRLWLPPEELRKPEMKVP